MLLLLEPILKTFTWNLFVQLFVENLLFVLLFSLGSGKAPKQRGEQTSTSVTPFHSFSSAFDLINLIILIAVVVWPWFNVWFVFPTFCRPFSIGTEKTLNWPATCFERKQQQQQRQNNLINKTRTRKKQVHFVVSFRTRD